MKGPVQLAAFAVVMAFAGCVQGDPTGPQPGQEPLFAKGPPEPGNASCLGYEASAVSPPGSSGEAPAGMRGILGDIDEFFVGSGAFQNRGAAISFFAQLPGDSHESCDEALMEAVFGGD